MRCYHGGNRPFCSLRGQKNNSAAPPLTLLKIIMFSGSKTGLVFACFASQMHFAKQAKTRGKPPPPPHFAVLSVFSSRRKKNALDLDLISTPGGGRCENAGIPAMDVIAAGAVVVVVRERRRKQQEKKMPRIGVRRWISGAAALAGLRDLSPQIENG